jgi:hypothetical protein
VVAGPAQRWPARACAYALPLCSRAAATHRRYRRYPILRRVALVRFHPILGGVAQDIVSDVRFVDCGAGLLVTRSAGLTLAEALKLDSGSLRRRVCLLRGTEGTMPVVRRLRAALTASRARLAAASHAAGGAPCSAPNGATRP